METNSKPAQTSDLTSQEVYEGMPGINNAILAKAKLSHQSFYQGIKRALSGETPLTQKKQTLQPVK